MALDPDWVQDLLEHKVTLRAGDSDSGEIGRAWIDGTLVVWDLQDPPRWLETVLEGRDDDGNYERKEVAYE